MEQVNTKPGDYKEEHSWFLRFYGRTDDEIRQCLKEITDTVLLPEFKYTITDTNTSVNFMIPNMCEPARQADLYFPDISGVVAFKKPAVSQVIIPIYHKWATKNPEANTQPIVRKPGDIAFGI